MLCEISELWIDETTDLRSMRCQPVIYGNSGCKALVEICSEVSAITVKRPQREGHVACCGNEWLLQVVVYMHVEQGLRVREMLGWR